MKDGNISGQDLDLGFIANEEGWVFAGPYTSVDLQAKTREDVSPRSRDIRVVAGTANIIQSLIVRLMTERGELEKLGHPKYGSRHHSLIGEPNTENNRSLVKLYILECLKQEPRIEEVLEITVIADEGRENRDKVGINIALKVKGEPDPLSFIIPFSFGGPFA